MIRETGHASFPRRAAAWLACLCIGLASTLAHAQPRSFAPADAMRGASESVDATASIAKAAAGTLTVFAPSVGLCIENYPSDAFTQLQQTQPGVWISYPSSTSCASLGMTIFAGNLAGHPEVRFYVSSPDAAREACQTGFLENCPTDMEAPGEYSDMWWNPDESGWGVAFIHHKSDIAFVAWYSYDASGNPKWYVASNCPMIGSSCTGDLYETTGPPFGPSFDPARVVPHKVGSVTFTFSSTSNGRMSYVLNGVSGSKVITRQRF